MASSFGTVSRLSSVTKDAQCNLWLCRYCCRALSQFIALPWCFVHLCSYMPIHSRTRLAASTIHLHLKCWPWSHSVMNAVLCSREASAKILWNESWANESHARGKERSQLQSANQITIHSQGAMKSGSVCYFTEFCLPATLPCHHRSVCLVWESKSNQGPHWFGSVRCRGPRFEVKQPMHVTCRMHVPCFCFLCLRMAQDLVQTTHRLAEVHMRKRYMQQMGDMTLWWHCVISPVSLIILVSFCVVDRICRCGDGTSHSSDQSNSKIRPEQLAWSFSITNMARRRSACDGPLWFYGPLWSEAWEVWLWAMLLHQRFEQPDGSGVCTAGMTRMCLHCKDDQDV